MAPATVLAANYDVDNNAAQTQADLPATVDDARVVEEAALRTDEPGHVLGAEAVTRVAPASRDGQISVPRVVDDES